MKQYNFNKGKLGEQIAVEFLKKKGYRLLETNFRTRFGELDIIASKDNILVFIEVKLKTGEDFGLPEEMVTPEKIRQVRQTAEVYLCQAKAVAAKFKQYRIDTVCLVLNEDYSVKEVRHHENLTE